MKFEELTKEQIELISDIYNEKDGSWDDRINKIIDIVGKSERTVRLWLVKLGLKSKVVAEDSEQFIKAQKRVHDKTKKRFIISWAQNNTPIHKELLLNIEKYSEFIDAEILVIAGRY